VAPPSRLSPEQSKCSPLYHWARTLPLIAAADVICPRFHFAGRFLVDEAAIKLKPRTVQNYRIYLGKHVAPAIGATKHDALSKADVSRLHSRIGQMAPVTANRVVECISSHIPIKNRRTKIAPQVAAALRLLMFTGARLREILHLRWENVDWDRSLLFLPDSLPGLASPSRSIPNTRAWTIERFCGAAS
jgi:integrase